MNNNLPKKKHSRADWHDYDQGFFFVTICTIHHECFFGNISNGNIILSNIGKIVEQLLFEIPLHNNDAAIDTYVIMPNHLHLIVRIGNMELQSAKDNYIRFSGTAKSHSGSALANLIGGLKSAASRKIRAIRPDFKWQERYWDTIITNVEQYTNIYNYIVTNPLNWYQDDYYIK